MQYLKKLPKVLLRFVGEAFSKQLLQSTLRKKSWQATEASSTKAFYNQTTYEINF